MGIHWYILFLNEDDWEGGCDDDCNFWKKHTLVTQGRTNVIQDGQEMSYYELNQLYETLIEKLKNNEFSDFDQSYVVPQLCRGIGGVLYRKRGPFKFEESR
jgi:hypothetical protein